jgi:hypothetical protein
VRNLNIHSEIGSFGGEMRRTKQFDNANHFQAVIIAFNFCGKKAKKTELKVRFLKG